MVRYTISIFKRKPDDLHVLCSGRADDKSVSPDSDSGTSSSPSLSPSARPRRARANARSQFIASKLSRMLQ